ncbi:carboxypeptidase-like regulatory domain-containing protein [Archangium lipolyticum]|uniref:carboxypeptidase-like regulatory domain-containing protein n=1 Tax=Archangium lipolyticum TaxID=2970465 RepID=UPI002149B537|nr:carboxypeptidase-like regulatory domain-containing protein [Archangium lipolyticum]
MVDDSGEGVAHVSLTLTDTTRLSGHVDKNGCGTYHPQESVWTGPDGRFRAELPFTPNEVSVSQAPDDFDPPRNRLPVMPGEEMTVTLRRIAWLVYEGQVVDAQGVPLAQVRIEPGESTDDSGHFKFKLRPEVPPEQFRFRKMGFKPVFVPAGETAKVVLRERRTLVKVKLLDEKTKQPAGGLYRVAAYRGGERLSFCTAGDVEVTHEPAVGECTLDAEPGPVELRVEGKPVRRLEVAVAPQEVSLEVAPPPPPPGNPY